jgi:hypothetical protein
MPESAAGQKAGVAFGERGKLNTHVPARTVVSNARAARQPTFWKTVRRNFENQE